MSTVTAVITIVVGVIAICSAVWGLIRAARRQAVATEVNSNAQRENTAAVNRLTERLDGHETRITDLEYWRKYGGSAHS